MEFKPLKAVYSFIFPEVWKALNSVKCNPDFFHTQVKAAALAQTYGDLLPSYPEFPNGNFNADGLHQPMKEIVLRAYAPLIPSLSTYKHFYPTAGSSEGLFHILCDLKLRGIKQINVLAGEYEGFGIQAGNLGFQVNVIPFDETPKAKTGWWIISQPSAWNGTTLPNAWFQEMADRGHKFVLDYAYVGLTAPRRFDLGGYIPEYSVLSLSKPYGVFAMRIGYAFAQEEMATLIGNKLWFRDNTRQLQAAAILQKVGPQAIQPKYKHQQVQIVETMRQDTQLPFKPAEALLLATLPCDTKMTAEQQTLLAPFKRHDNYRLCLTPYFEDLNK
jgi:histidinol-phosphate/aromatic aminotransferase/cobyric acid decarboxylase-like protein